MADLMEFENVEHPESSEFGGEEKSEDPGPGITEPESTETTPEPEEPVSSSTDINFHMDEPAKHEEEKPNPVIEEPTPFEEPKVESTESEEKPPQEPTATTTSRELTSFPARWMKEQGIDQKVIDLIYWQDLKKTAVVFSTLLVLLTSLHCYSLLSVLTFFSMAVLTVALLYRVGMTVMGAIQKSGTDNPFKNLLEKKIDVPKEKAAEVAEFLADHINCTTKSLRKLFLVEDIVDSIKFGVALWVLSYIGAWFSMLTLVIIDVLLIFSVPKIYEMYQDKIDEHLKVVRTQVNAIIEQAKSKLPEKLRPKEKTT